MLPMPALRTVVSIVLGFAVLAVLGGCSGGDSSGFRSMGTAQAAEREKTKVIAPGQRESAPQITGTTLEGETLSLDSLEGRVVVLNFWASWCGPCRDEVPVLQKIQHRTADEGVRLVGVDVKDSKANAKAFVRNFDIGYPSIYDQPGQIALQFRDTVPPSAVPSTIVLDRRGRVAGRIIGEAHYDQLMSMVKGVAGDGADAHESSGS